MAEVRACPTPEELRQLALGLLPEPRGEACAAHVQQCPSCQVTLRSLSVRDPLLDAVARLGRDGRADDTPDEPPSPGSAPAGCADSETVAPAGPVLAEASHVRLHLPGTEAHTPAHGPGPAEAPADGAPPAPPARLRLVGEIARGGMGAVLMGHDANLGRDVAVKVLLEAHASRAELARRFVEEAQIAGQLQHPGIVPVYELGAFADRRPYFTMKLVKGRTLAALLAERKTPADDLPRFLGIFGQVCQAVAYAHSRGVIHRDLKPANVMVGAFGEVQVMDWGLAKVLPERDAVDDTPAEPRASMIRTARSREAAAAEAGMQTQAGTLLGTPAYVAPEQARGDVDLVDERCDVFGLGAVLCEILTGEPPFAGKGLEAARKAQLGLVGAAHARLDACGADAELAGLAKRCLAAEPWDRPRHAGEVAEAVTAYQNAVAERLRQAELARAAEEARAVEARATAAHERRARRLTLALAAAVLLLVVGGGGGLAWVRRQREARQAATTREVMQAVSEAHFVRGQAESTGELARWSEARAAARRADALAAAGDADPALRQRTRGLLDDIEQAADAARERAARDEKDRRLIAQMMDIRSGAGDQMSGPNQDFAATDARYARALRDYGVDVDALAPEQVKDWLERLGKGVRVELAACLDDWAHARRLTDKAAGATHLTDVARLLDPDPLRNRVRTAIDRKDLPALQEIAARPEVRAAPPATVNLLAVYLGFGGDVAGAIRLLTTAQGHHPGDFQINHNLAWFSLYQSQPPQPQVALRYSTAAVAVRPRSVAARFVLLDAYQQIGDKGQATAVLQELAGLQRDPGLYTRLAGLFYEQGRKADAVAASRKAAELNPKSAALRSDLGAALLQQGNWREAAAAYREALALDPKQVLSHNNLGVVLRQLGQAKEAEAEFRRAVEIDPRYKASQNNLGAVLLQEGKLDEAEAAFRQALLLDPKQAGAHAGLGMTLLRECRLADARASLRRGLAGFPEGHPNHSVLTRELRWCERLIPLEPRLPQVLAGTTRPADAAEQRAYADLCRFKKLPAAAARLYAEAFAADPVLANNLRDQARYGAACAATLAGSGRGEDAAKLDEAERGRWRRQAVDWLRADLDVCGQRLERGTPQDRMFVHYHLRFWQEDGDLAGIRDEGALAKLPADERAACRKLWDDVEALATKADALPGA
jgi:serine/threonine-protein kinase